MAAFALPDQRATWVMAGDSITQGVYHTHLSRSWVEHVHERVRWQLDRLGDSIINSGVSGWTAPKILGDFEYLVARFDPDIVSLSLGTNDANAGADGLDTFRDSMTALIECSQRLGAQVILHTPVLATAGASRALALPLYAAVVRDLADETDTVLVDHEKYWLQHFDGLEPIPWMDDHSHPNAVGHVHMANLTLRTLELGELEDRP